ncbi:XdhC family protein [Calditrichota bacterium]
MNSQIWRKVAELSEKGEAFCLAVITKSSGSVPRRAGSMMLVERNGDSIGTVGGGSVEQISREEALLAMKDGKPRMREMELNDPGSEDTGSICGGKLTVFFMPQGSQAVLHLFGAGHVAKPTAHLAATVGYNVIVYDDIYDYATEDRFPDAIRFEIGNLPEKANELFFSVNDAVVIMTASHEYDYKILCGFKDNLPPYLGVIASAKKAKHFRISLADAGWNEEDINKIHAPIGLEIGSRTPEEIAVSIVAELIKTKDPVE